MQRCAALAGMDWTGARSKHLASPHHELGRGSLLPTDRENNENSTTARLPQLRALLLAYVPGRCRRAAFPHPLEQGALCLAEETLQASRFGFGQQATSERDYTCAHASDLNRLWADLNRLGVL